MENKSNGMSHVPPHKIQQVPYGIVYTDLRQGAIMESLDPSLVGNDIEHEMAAAIKISSGSKKQGKQDVKGSTYTERNNMNSSTNSYGSAGNLSIHTSCSYFNLFRLIKRRHVQKLKVFFISYIKLYFIGNMPKNSTMQREFLSNEELQSLNLHSAGQVKTYQQLEFIDGNIFDILDFIILLIIILFWQFYRMGIS